MANAFRCIAALNKAAGKELTDHEVQSLFEQIAKTAADLESGKIKTDGADLSSREAILTKAAELSADHLIKDKQRQVRNTEMRIATLGERQAEVAAMKTGGIGDVDAVRRLMVNDMDGRSNQFSLEARVIGTTNLLKARIQSTWEALGGDFLGMIQNKEKIRDLITEMRGGDSGNPLAKKGAQAWLKVTDDARRWFNDKGGKIGFLDDWSMPQHHSQEMIARAGKAQWIADVLPLLNREKYTDGAGFPMGDTALRTMLDSVWDNIATNGVLDIEPGQFRGRGALANAHAQHRDLHFKDADAYIGYWAKYGERTFPDILLGHIERMARDIAFIEHFGPNPDVVYRTLRDQAEVSAKMAAPELVGKIDKELARLDNLYDYASGRSRPVANRQIGKTFDAIRNLNVAGKLGSAFWASFFGDKVMMEAMGRVNHLPVLKSWFNELRLLNPFNAAERRMLQRQSLMLDYMRSSLHRFGDELGQSGWTGKMANVVMKVSGMAAINEWRRGAFALTMMDAIGHQVSTKAFSEIGPQDMHLLHTFGITELDWRIWKLANLDDLGHGNNTALTPEGIAKISDDALKQAGIIPVEADAATARAVRREAIVKYLGALHSESMNAIIEPGWDQRAKMFSGLQRGNLRDELVRSFWQFKSFPIAQFQRIWDIGMTRPTAGGKIQFLSAVLMMQTLAGAMMLQTQSTLSGQDPRPMDDWKFWLASFIKGGSLGIYGDFLYSNAATTRYGSGPLEVLAGPTIGTAATAVTSMIQAGNAVADGRETHLGAKLLNMGKGYIPGQNLWYTRAATDHIIFQNAQEVLSPGYLANMRANSVRQFGQDWWWTPGEFTPDRAPDFAAAAGQ